MAALRRQGSGRFPVCLGRDPAAKDGSMSFEEFKETVAGARPPQVSGPLLALWHDARGDWDAAHNAVQSDASPDGAWVHAYLHRKEGDAGNAGYWYRRAGRPMARGDLAAESDAIAAALLAK
jgi:hypothetical protein